MVPWLAEMPTSGGTSPLGIGERCFDADELGRATGSLQSTADTTTADENANRQKQ
jgi:hypothetical protein